MAKSVLDAGWSMLKTQLKYKAIARSGGGDVVNDSYSTQACSCCGAISDNNPKGRAGLQIRKWTYCECGTAHDRDVNTEKNILAVGHAVLSVEGGTVRAPIEAEIHAFQYVVDLKRSIRE